MDKLHVAAVASETVWQNAAQNIKNTEAHVQRLLRHFPETQIILFPEISLMGFVTDDTAYDIAEPLDGRCVSEVGRIARENDVAIIAGMIESGNDALYNTSFVVDRGGDLLGSYRKNHLFTQSPEPEFYAPGETLSVFEIEGWKCGMAICFDIRFPRLFESYKSAGVECVFTPCNWLVGRNKVALLDVLSRTRAHENQFFMVVTDRSGTDPNSAYHGISIISNPYGENIIEKKGIYSRATLDRSDIDIISKALPLQSSYKSNYKIR